MKIHSTLDHFLKTIPDNKILCCKQCVTAKHVFIARPTLCCNNVFCLVAASIFSICIMRNFELMVSNNKNK